MNQVIEPEFKFLATGSVSIAQQKNHKLIANVQVEPNFDRNPIHAAATVTGRQQQGQQERPTQSVGPTEETDQKKLNQAKAAYNKCIQVLNKLQFPEEQSQQVCQLLVESMILAVEDEEEQDPNNQQQNNLKQNSKKPTGTPSGNVTQQGPPMSGFVGNTSTPSGGTCAKTAAILNKEIEIKTAQVEKLNTEVTTERQAHQSRMNQITELENTVHRLQLENYLRKHIDSENMIKYQAMKFASKGFNVDDLKDIYEDIPVRIASNKTQHIPKSKVRLRTASTDESNNDSSRFNNVRETNEKLTNAFFGISSNSNLYDDYIG